MIGSIDHFVDQQIFVWQEKRRIAERNAFRFRYGSSSGFGFG